MFKAEDYENMQDVEQKVTGRTKDDDAVLEYPVDLTDADTEVFVIVGGECGYCHLLEFNAVLEKIKELRRNNPDVEYEIHLPLNALYFATDDDRRVIYTSRYGAASIDEVDLNKFEEDFTIYRRSLERSGLQYVEVINGQAQALRTEVALKVYLWSKADKMVQYFHTRDRSDKTSPDIWACELPVARAHTQEVQIPTFSSVMKTTKGTRLEYEFTTPAKFYFHYRPFYVLTTFARLLEEKTGIQIFLSAVNKYNDEVTRFSIPLGEHQESDIILKKMRDFTNYYDYDNEKGKFFVTKPFDWKIKLVAHRRVRQHTIHSVLQVLVRFFSNTLTSADGEAWDVSFMSKIGDSTEHLNDTSRMMLEQVFQQAGYQHKPQREGEGHGFTVHEKGSAILGFAFAYEYLSNLWNVKAFDITNVLIFIAAVWALYHLIRALYRTKTWHKIKAQMRRFFSRETLRKIIAKEKDQPYLRHAWPMIGSWFSYLPPALRKLASVVIESAGFVWGGSYLVRWFISSVMGLTVSFALQQHITYLFIIAWAAYPYVKAYLTKQEIPAYITSKNVIAGLFSAVLLTASFFGLGAEWYTLISILLPNLIIRFNTRKHFVLGSGKSTEYFRSILGFKKALKAEEAMLFNEVLLDNGYFVKGREPKYIVVDDYLAAGQTEIKRLNGRAKLIISRADYQELLNMVRRSLTTGDGQERHQIAEQIRNEIITILPLATHIAYESLTFTIEDLTDPEAVLVNRETGESLGDVRLVKVLKHYFIPQYTAFVKPEDIVIKDLKQSSVKFINFGLRMEVNWDTLERLARQLHSLDQLSQGTSGTMDSEYSIYTIKLSFRRGWNLMNNLFRSKVEQSGQEQGNGNNNYNLQAKQGFAPYARLCAFNLAEE